LFVAFGTAAVYVELGESPSVANVLSLLAVLSVLLGVTLSPRVLFGRVTLGRHSPLFPPVESGKGWLSQFPKSLAFGLAAFAVFTGASFIARHL
jgi:hypothetical protein